MKWRMQLFFCMQIYVKVFYKLKLPFVVDMVWHAHITNQIVIFLEE